DKRKLKGLICSGYFLPLFSCVNGRITDGLLTVVRPIAGNNSNGRFSVDSPSPLRTIESHTCAIHSRSSLSTSVGLSKCPRPCSDHRSSSLLTRTGILQSAQLTVPGLFF